MRLQCITAVAVEAKTLARQPFILIARADDFGHALEAAEALRHLRGKRDQHVVEGLRRRILADNYRYILIGIVGDRVRNKAAGSEGPEQVVESLRFGGVGGVNIDAVSEQKRLVRQSAHRHILGHCRFVSVCGAIVEQVEVDPGHGRGSWSPWSAWLMRYCVSSGTGRPVAPFSLPVFHAVPAMSRCAHLKFLA